MRREHGFGEIRRDERSVITIGTFDGLHRGHQAILEYLIECARAVDGTSTVVTFDPHPREVVRGESVPLLTTLDERAEILARLGIDRFVIIPFTHELSQMSAPDYVRRVLVDTIGARDIVIGYDHAFGRNREGDADLLREMGKELGFGINVIPAQVVGRHVVSSTEVRHAVEGGDVIGAASMLGRYYSIDGIVVEGDRRGREIGFPTANLKLLDPRKVTPSDGVYAVWVVDEEGRRHPGMMNIGVRPTVDGTDRRYEVHLIDFDGDLYGRRLRTEFVERTRSERRFASLDKLTRQLSKDRIRCKAVLGLIP